MRLIICIILILIAYQLGNIQGMLEKHHKMMIAGISCVGDSLDELGGIYE